MTVGRADEDSSAAQTPRSAPEPRGWRQRIGGAARRTGKIVAISVVVLLVLLVSLVLLLLYSNAALTIAIDQGLGLYNDRIAGEIRIAEVEGRLADHLALRGIALVDAEGIEVVAVGEVRLDWRWSGLRSRALDVSSLRVAQAVKRFELRISAKRRVLGGSWRLKRRRRTDAPRGAPTAQQARVMPS